MVSEPIQWKFVTIGDTEGPYNLEEPLKNDMQGPQ
jgi:hypothetical protein